MAKLFFTLFFAVVLFRLSANTVTGCVFYDENQNGVCDLGDNAIMNVPVSNGHELVLTDRDGFFTIEVQARSFVFVVKNDDFVFPVDENYLPRFYYAHFPEGSPSDLNYQGFYPTGALPDTLWFPVLHAPQNEAVKALVLGDPQMADSTRLSFFRRGIVNKLAMEQADFYLTLGDIADNYLDILPRERELMAKLAIPGYRVIGNHDLNYKAENNEYAAESFRAVYGPDNFSFNYPGQHFILLNNVNYHGWNFDQKSRGSYFGGLSEKQLQWIKADLEQVDPERNIVIVSHIPFMAKYCREGTIDSLVQLLEGFDQVLMLSGHLHAIQNHRIERNNHPDIKGLVAGATCGAWWTGPYNENGLPYASCMDGSPLGYYRFSFAETGNEKAFVPVHYPENFQARLNVIPIEGTGKYDLIVNWFDGFPGDSLFLKVDEQELVPLYNFKGASPFIRQTLHLRSNIDDWTPGIAVSDHLWKTDKALELEGENTLLRLYTGRNNSSLLSVQIEEIPGLVGNQ